MSVNSSYREYLPTAFSTLILPNSPGTNSSPPLSSLHSPQQSANVHTHLIKQQYSPTVEYDQPFKPFKTETDTWNLKQSYVKKPDFYGDFSQVTTQSQQDLSSSSISKIAQLEQANQRLNLEVETWKAKYVKLEQSAAKALSAQAENERLFSERHKLGTELANLESLRIQNLQLHQQNYILNEEKTRFSAILNEKDKQLQELRIKLGQSGQSGGDGEHRVMMLIGEKERLIQEKNQLNNYLAEKVREIDYLKARLNEADHLANQLNILGNERNSLNQVLLDKTKENEILRNKYSNLPQIEFLERENQVLKQKVEERDRLLAGMKNQIDIFEQELKLINELQSKVTLLVADNERLTGYLVNKDKELDSMRMKMSSYNEKLREMEMLSMRMQEFDKEIGVAHELRNKINQLVSENERLNNNLREKNQRIHELEHSESSAVNDLKSKLSNSMFEIQRLGGLLIDRDKELQELRGRLQQVGQVEHRIMLLMTEKDRLNTLVAEKMKEVDMLRAKIDEAEYMARHLGEDNNRLNHILMEKTKENDMLKNKASAVFQLGEQMEHAERDKEMLRRTIQEKEKIIVDLRSQLSGYDQKLRSSIMEKDKINAVLSETFSEIEVLRSKVATLEKANGSTAELQAKIRQLSIENEKLFMSAKEKTETIKNWESKYASLQELYLNVKEATEQLEVIKNKYKTAMKLSEKIEPGLILSNDARISRKAAPEYDNMRHSQDEFWYTQTHTSKGSIEGTPSKTQNRSYY